MSIGRKQIGALIAVILVAAGLSGFGPVPSAERSGLTSISAAPSITIRTPSAAVSGETFCFEVVCYAGVSSVTAELNDVILPATATGTDDPTVTVFCVRIPLGCAGSTLNLTAVSPTGAVATASVPVT
jgi:hypothetical protein